MNSNVSKCGVMKRGGVLDLTVMGHWPATVAEARLLQDELAARVRIQQLPRTPLTVCGVDAAFAGDRVFAAASLLDFCSLALLEEATAVLPVTFPYVPGYLSFREGPAIMAALQKLSRRPDLLIVDGQGIAHPRRLGIASFLGVLLDMPTIGCAKSRLVGEYDEPAPKRGSWSPLIHKRETVGAVLRTRDRVRPVFVSPGHLITLEESIEIVLRAAVKYRLPEPQRAADHLAGRAKRNAPPTPECLP